MADFYVSSAGSDTSPFDTWAKAATAELSATALANSADDRVFSHAETETIAIDTTYTLTGNPMVLGTNDLVNEPPQTEGVRTIDGSATSGVDITFAGIGFCRKHIFKNGGSTGLANINFGAADGDTLYFEECEFHINNSNANSAFRLGSAANGVNIKVVTKKCKWVFAGAGAGPGFILNCQWVSIDDEVLVTGTQPTTLFKPSIAADGAHARIIGMDLSAITGTIIGNQTGLAPVIFEFYGCKLNAAATRFAAQTSEACAEALWYDCSSGDVHYNIAHDSFLGSTTVSASIYANAGATFDGSTHYSWIVAGSANATFQRPYRSPWFYAYNTDIATSVTPRLETLRDGSATRYNDDELWGEWTYKDASGFPLVGLVDDRRGMLAAAAAQAASSLTASDWTGENATACFMKLEPAAFTPSEIGYIGARACVAGNFTAYVDPKIYGISTVTNVNTERVFPSGWNQTNMAAAGGSGGNANILRGSTVA